MLRDTGPVALLKLRSGESDREEAGLTRPPPQPSRGLRALPTGCDLAGRSSRGQHAHWPHGPARLATTGFAVLAQHFSPTTVLYPSEDESSD